MGRVLLLAAASVLARSDAVLHKTRHMANRRAALAALALTPVQCARVRKALEREYGRKRAAPMDWLFVTAHIGAAAAKVYFVGGTAAISAASSSRRLRRSRSR